MSIEAVAERRAHQRRRVLKTGRIVFNDRSSVLNCTIRNLSGEGALLRIPLTLDVPHDFDLLIEGAGAARCWVAWKNDHQLGVAFR